MILKNEDIIPIDQLFIKGAIPEKILKKIAEIVSQKTKEINEDVSDYLNINIAQMIDHTMLNPNATIEDIKKLCNEAIQYKFHAVCVNPVYIPICKDLLNDSSIRLCTVISFPLGGNTHATKSFEAKNAELMGVDEVDMVINIGALKDRNIKSLREDISSVIDSTSKKVVKKVILENAYLTMEEKMIGCLIAKDAGADFVKTSTGFGPSGATIEDVTLMRFVVGEDMGVKAAGGIRDYITAIKMLKAGANRIGASSSVKILQSC